MCQESKLRKKINHVPVKYITITIPKVSCNDTDFPVEASDIDLSVTCLKFLSE